MMGPNEKVLQDSIVELSKTTLSMNREDVGYATNVLLLTSIATSLAIIADERTEEDWKNADTGSDKADSDKS